MISNFISFMDKIKISLSDNYNFNYGYYVDNDLIDDNTYIYNVLFNKKL